MCIHMHDRAFSIQSATKKRTILRNGTQRVNRNLVSHASATQLSQSHAQLTHPSIPLFSVLHNLSSASCYYIGVSVRLLWAV